MSLLGFSYPAIFDWKTVILNTILLSPGFCYHSFFCLFCYHSLKSINFCSGKLLGDQLDHFKACLYALLSEKAMAPHSSTLAWKIPWTEEPGRLQSMGSWRVGHDWATLLSLFTFMHWRRKWQPTQVFLPGESQGQGSLVGSVYGVAQSRTRLKWLSSSSMMSL